jgi:hypothetical protein
MAPNRPIRVIRQGHVDAYRVALHQAGMVFDRTEPDTAANPRLIPLCSVESARPAKNTRRRPSCRDA